MPLSIILLSCSTVGKLVTNAVAYQSVRTEQYKADIPDDATIAVGYSIGYDGSLIAIVRNLTDQIMIIDQTKSFFVNSDGLSTSYYDPTVRTTSSTDIQSNTGGASVNLGAIGGALGIGGPLSGILSGINVGGSNTVGTSTTNTTYFADLPQISLAPKSHGAMSKTFIISGIGGHGMSDLGPMNSTYTPQSSNCKFSVCISYSVDGGNSFEKIVTPFYVNALIACPVKRHGQVNEALREVLTIKPDALGESWWTICAVNNYDLDNNGFSRGFLTDYK